MALNLTEARIPDSKLAKEATEILREHGTPLLFNHSLRVYFFGCIQGTKAGLKFDPELLFLSAARIQRGAIKRG